MKINNFSAGPSKIPQTVLDQLGKDIIGYKDLGYSVLELSHRSQEFDEILQDTKKNLVNILNIPKNFDVIFLQGGATFQNTFIAANKPSLFDNIIFLLTGTWGTKTYEDFQKYSGKKISKISLSDQKLEDLVEEVNLHKSEYLYLTSNETIEGIQFKNFNCFNKKLIIDMSSDICSYKFDWDNISFIYAGAQKNLGIPGVTICILENDFIEENNLTSYLNAKNHINKNSAFNTPPTFSIYVMLNILNWININGGIEQIEENNISKANKIYRLIDENLEKLIPLAPKDLRSTSNIVFDFKDKSKTEQFLKQSSENGFLGLNGHRSIGGVRISNYNSISQEMVSNLLDFIQKFLSSY